MKFLRFTGLSDKNLLTLIIVHLYGHAILEGESIPNGGPPQIYPCLVQVLLNAVQYMINQNRNENMSLYPMGTNKKYNIIRLGLERAC